MTQPTLLAHLGGVDALRRTVADFYGTVLADPLLHPLFGDGRPEHVDHLTAFLAEVFGGQARYTDELGGFPALLAAHRGLKINDEQRARFVALFLAAADRTGLPADPPFRAALAGYLDFGTEVAQVNSHATSDADLHECQEVPRWSW
jgi:hemoglobin